MKKIEILAYIEDDVLSVGIRSLKPHDELTMFDGEYHFEYFIVEKGESAELLRVLNVTSIGDRYVFRLGTHMIGYADDTNTFSYEISI
jgi:hypothetical protein